MNPDPSPSEWDSTSVRELVAAVQSVADDTNKARYDGPGFNIEKVMDDLLGALGGITNHLDGIDAQLELERHAADERIVEIIVVPEPIISGDKAIMGWAITAEGATLPVTTTAANPRPQIHRSVQ